MSNFVLIAVPLFVFMGVMFEKSGIAEELLETMALIFGKFRGGLAIGVLLVGALFGASTGIVGATVVTMGVISLPRYAEKRLFTSGFLWNHRSIGNTRSDYPAKPHTRSSWKCIKLTCW